MLSRAELIRPSIENLAVRARRVLPVERHPSAPEFTMESLRRHASPAPRRLVRWGALLLLALAVALASCAPGPNPLVHHHAPGAAPLAGFFLGIWHGAIVWVTFVASLFLPGVSVYEVHNTGWPYNLGFVLGAASFHGGGGGGASEWRRRRERRVDVS